MIVGIIGVGHLAASILSGLLRAGVNPASICCHPVARRMRFPHAAPSPLLLTMMTSLPAPT